MKKLKQFMGLFLVLVLLFSCADKGKLIDSVVTTKYGKLQGAINLTSDVVAFKGVPYAAPPVGDLRWTEPQPPAAWEGVKDATAFCASCIQLNNRRLPWTEEYMIKGETSEDCLFLNIWTPAKTASDNLPVLVWIHGGGMREGSGSIDVYDGEELAKKGIIVVSINYRLGMLGFLAHPWLTEESSHKASGDYGFMDQVAALRWINENISAFGGNPDKVTIAGQSAGSRSVHMLTVTPLAKGLFSGAAVLSGASMGRIEGVSTLAEAEARGDEFVNSKGVTNLAELRALPAEELIADGGITVDGWFLPESPVAIIEKGMQNDVPTIAGLVSDEGSSSADYGKTTKEEFVKNAKENYVAKEKEFLSLYPVSSDEEAGLMSIEVAREKGRFDLYKWAKFRNATAKTSVFTYYFSRGIPWPEHPEFGAHHTSDVTYWFNNLKKLDRPWTSIDTLVAETASSYLVNLVTKGDPNGEGLPVWPAFDGSKKETMEIGASTAVMPVASDAKVEFFEGL